MANLDLMHDQFIPTGDIHHLTFILPAPQGCNLKCSFCIIRQRREIGHTALQPQDYPLFIRQVAERLRVGAISIQGYEPLLAEAMPYTLAILRAARSLSLPAGLVTNGVCLGEAAAELAEAPPARISVSLDSPHPDSHDRLRGVPGAWESAVDGIERARELLAPHGTRIGVISVLQRRNASELADMPGLLGGMRIRNWTLDVMLRVGPGGREAVSGHSAWLRPALSRLVGAARSRSIAIAVDDELGLLRSSVGNDGGFAEGLPIRTLPPGVTISRLLPSGHCSVGSAARGLQPSPIQWTPQANAAAFLAPLLARHWGFAEAA